MMTDINERINTGWLRAAVDNPVVQADSGGEVAISHGMLDAQNVPRELYGRVLPLDERVRWYIREVGQRLSDMNDMIQEAIDE